MATEKWLEENAEYMREYHRKYNRQNKERQKRYKDRLVAWLTEYKRTQGCKTCGEKHPACLDLHHRNAGEKTTGYDMGFARCIRAKGWGLKRLQEEAAKCDVVCSNCHRKHHWDNGGLGKHNKPG